MEITFAIVITAITYVCGEITKLTEIPNKFIPLQNVIIAILTSIICIVFKVDDLSPIEAIIYSIFATMSAGGLSDLSKITDKKDEGI